MLIPRAVAVVVDGPRVLVIKRFLRHELSDACVMCQDSGWVGGRCPGHHYAVLPGGHVEEGETAETAALRELDEETTLEAEIGRLLWQGPGKVATGAAGAGKTTTLATTRADPVPGPPSCRLLSHSARLLTVSGSIDSSQPVRPP